MRRSLAAWLRSRRPVWLIVVAIVWSLGWGITFSLLHQWPVAIIHGVFVVANLALLEWGRRGARRDRRVRIWVDASEAGYAPPAGFDELAARRAYDDSVAARNERKEQARALLLSVLTPHQRSVYEQEGYVPVCGSRGGEYRIFPHRNSNVQVRHKGGYACAVIPGGGSPVEEQMLAQYLALITDERAFLRVAIL